MREGAKLDFAKKLRSNMTEAEKRLWYYLRAGRFDGFKFRRQAPIEGYIVDFVCIHPPLVIEVDGGQHEINKEIDRKRDDVLKKRGFTILRFWNNDVMDNIEGVLMTIKNTIENIPLPYPSPASGRGERELKPLSNPRQQEINNLNSLSRERERVRERAYD